MIWNTIVHPKMMIDNGTAALRLAPGSVAEGIKYADPHKLSFFDLLVDATDLDNPKLVHGDFETVKKKILNHELVIGGVVAYITLHELNVSIAISDSISYNDDSNAITLDISRGSGSIMYIISSDNAVGTPGAPDDGSGGTVINA